MTTLSNLEWIVNTNAIGIVSKSGRYGGTFAHFDIAFELHPGYLRNLSYILLSIIKDLKAMKAANFHWAGI